MILYTPKPEDLWFRKMFMSDEETMSYNHNWGGTIPFPEEQWQDWHDYWIVNPEGKRFYKYLQEESTGEFVGEIAYHFDEEEQKYIADVIVYAKYRGNALAQAYVYRNTAFPFAIYADKMLVGFIMLGYYEARNQYTLWKFLIDKKYQNKGYGKEALKQGIQYLQNTFHAKEIYTGVSVGNEQAKHVYKLLGFMETGLVEDGMEELKFTIWIVLQG